MMATLSDALASRAQSSLLEQRARLLDAVWTDRRACGGLLPAALQPLGPAAMLDAYAADLALAPDGTWRVWRDCVGEHPGRDVLQAPLLAVFLPALCRSLLGQTLLLPSWPVWWWRDTATRDRVAAEPGRYYLRDGLDAGNPGVCLASLSAASRIAAQRDADRQPERFVVTLAGEPADRQRCKRILTIR